MIPPTSFLVRGLLACLAIALTTCSGGPADTTRRLEINTEEVTSPDVAVSLDGSTLVFSLLGQLFELPTGGGTAIQLTSGPFYHHDPAFAPDGKRLAFASNRDGSEDNVFVMDLGTREIHQVTHEPRAGRPAWSPDGRFLIYLSYLEASRFSDGEAHVREIELESGTVRDLEASGRTIQSVFYTRDGVPAWSVVEEPDEGEARTRVELANDDGPPVLAATIPGAADRVSPSSLGNGYFARSQTEGAHLVWVRADSTESMIADLTPVYSWYNDPRFAVARDDGSVFLGEEGHLWRVSAEDGTIEEVRFRAAVSLEVAELTPIPATPLPRSIETPTISSPRLTPDGQALVFGAFGSLWTQSLSGGTAARLTTDDALERDPAIRPDGRELAYVRVVGGEQELRIRDLESGADRTIHRGSVLLDPAWSPDGASIAVASHGGRAFSILVLDAAESTGEPLVIEAGSGSLSPRPHFSDDGRWLYYRLEATDTATINEATIQRVAVEPGSEPQPVARIPNHLGNALVSPDARWLAFRRDHELWIAPLDSGLTTVSESGARRLSATGGPSFAFIPDGQSLIYAEEGRVWRHSLAEEMPAEVPFELAIDRETAPPLLLRNVRALDFSSGTFGAEISVFVDDGRIRWMGPEAGHEVPSETQVLDAAGRYAIPGLFDVHNHVGIAGGDQAAFVANGVTTVRDMGGRVGSLATLAERSSMTSRPMPRYVYSGDFLIGRPRRTLWGNMLSRGEDQVRAGIRGNQAGGAGFIKVYFSVPWPLQLVAAEEARRLGLPIAAHGMHVHEVTREVTLGYRFLEHIDPEGRFFDDVNQLLALSDTYWTPTFSLGGAEQLLVLETSTLRAAEALGVAQDVGSLEAGKLADIVLLDADPLENIGNAQAIWRVIKGGWVFDPDELLADSNR